MVEASHNKNETPPQKSRPFHSRHSSHLSLVLWYIAFGALHELAHIATAVACGLSNLNLNGILQCNDGWIPLMYRVLLGRHVVLPAGVENSDHEFLVRHAGWMFSIVLAMVLNKSSSSAKKFAVRITALEALATDLLQLPILAGIGISHIPDTSHASAVFCCGNFGVILLHHLWLTEQGKNALDCLEEMVKVTMMRGAQSGGVITYAPNSSGSSFKGIRSRVVNRKRTDLSVEVRRKVQRDVFGGLVTKHSRFPKDHVLAMSGHTRFATSSKASFEGTHPQQWTPASLRRVYDFDIPHNPAGESQFQHVHNIRTIPVENFITHNGDFDFYDVNGKTYDLETIQKWLVVVTGSPMPAVVDSCGVAGIVDLLRTQGCFGLSARYTICLGLKTSKPEDTLSSSDDFPSYAHFETIGTVFEQVLGEMLKNKSTCTTSTSLVSIGDSPEIRHSFALRVLTKLQASPNNGSLIKPLEHYLTNDEEGGDASLLHFCLGTIDAFFDNDLFFTTKTFLKHAKGSFGLCITSSLDAHRQICLAARGQTMSIGFYPNKRLVCYGSEQAAVKAGMNAVFPGKTDALGRPQDELGRPQDDIDNDALRLDLDDLGGEIICLDWGRRVHQNHPVSKPNQFLVEHELMNGCVSGILYQESKSTIQDPQLYHRMTRLSRNRFIKPLRPDSKDLVLSDIQDIPKICQAIQDEWHVNKAAQSLNRLTAYNLQRCLRDRLEDHVEGKVPALAIDILLTGCEVSLWLAEQFASDMQKSFPRLRIKAISSNKLLGLYGQEIAVPALGHAYSPKTSNLNGTIVVIVSHSGGTFAPLSCSNLLQSTTKNIFVVTSEWDTQIGKQLRAMDALKEEDDDHIFNSRVFSTDVGMRPAEPCSISVVATHQLLTNLFEYISVVILSDARYRRITAAVITEQDLQVLERCNQMNIAALTETVSVNRQGHEQDIMSETEKELRAAGDLWADHILENVKAYIMTAIYIFVTVISGHPLVYSLFRAAGMVDASNDWVYFIRVVDACIYFWLPQINVTLIRLCQGRNLLHRMTGRTVVIGDIPWVSQCAEAFLSKIFACSYSIAGLNVLSGNPADHFVHRHTHRVARGSLVICGRPDGRLSALSTAEAAVCLSVNQASSIQSWGGTCESITIGHNPFKLDLSQNGIFLKRKRPMFLCERMLVETDAKDEKESKRGRASGSSYKAGRRQRAKQFFLGKHNSPDLLLDRSLTHLDSSVAPKKHMRRSAAALLGAYMNMEGIEDDDNAEVHDEAVTVDAVVFEAIQERKWSDLARKLFQALGGLEGNGFLSEDDFVRGCSKISKNLTQEQARDIFCSADIHRSGRLDYDEFLNLLNTTNLEQSIKAPPSNRNDKGVIQIEASPEKYFGETLRKYNAGKSMKDLDFMLARSQHFSQELYETRIASLQRFVAMTVIFHQMGKRVQEFFVKISFGWWGYRMDRTHSIMRIATTASPVSGADVRQRMRHLRLLTKVNNSIHIISVAYQHYKERKEVKRIKELEHQASSMAESRHAAKLKRSESTSSESETSTPETSKPVQSVG